MFKRYTYTPCSTASLYERETVGSRGEIVDDDRFATRTPPWLSCCRSSFLRGRDVRYEQIAQVSLYMRGMLGSWENCCGQFNVSWGQLTIDPQK